MDPYPNRSLRAWERAAAASALRALERRSVQGADPWFAAGAIAFAVAVGVIVALLVAVLA